VLPALGFFVFPADTILYATGVPISYAALVSLPRTKNQSITANCAVNVRHGNSASSAIGQFLTSDGLNSNLFLLPPPTRREGFPRLGLPVADFSAPYGDAGVLKPTVLRTSKPQSGKPLPIPMGRKGGTSSGGPVSCGTKISPRASDLLSSAIHCAYRVHWPSGLGRCARLSQGQNRNRRGARPWRTLSRSVVPASLTWPSTSDESSIARGVPTLRARPSANLREQEINHLQAIVPGRRAATLQNESARSKINPPQVDF